MMQHVATESESLGAREMSSHENLQMPLWLHRTPHNSIGHVQLTAQRDHGRCVESAGIFDQTHE
jgi:hypothetical protein